MPPPVKKCTVGNKNKGHHQSCVDNLTSPECDVTPEDDHANSDVQYFVDEDGHSHIIESLFLKAEPGVPPKNDIKKEKDDDAYQEDEEVEESNPKPKRPKHSCSICSYTSNRLSLLKSHMTSHSDVRPHVCSICQRSFKTNATLQIHVNMHNGIKPRICQYCQSTFTTSGELVRHVRYKHTLEKPHRCTECDFACVELSKLRRHARCHTGERPYKCPHCTYAAVDTSQLKRHLHTHTGEKPYKCDLCNMVFTQSNSLKSHKRIHNEYERPVYGCDRCPGKYKHKYTLISHVEKMHSDILIKCKRCNKSFPDRYSYKMHNKGGYKNACRKEQ